MRRRLRHRLPEQLERRYSAALLTLHRRGLLRALLPGAPSHGSMRALHILEVVVRAQSLAYNRPSGRLARHRERRYPNRGARKKSLSRSDLSNGSKSLGSKLGKRFGDLRKIPCTILDADFEACALLTSDTANFRLTNGFEQSGMRWRSCRGLP